MNNATKGKPRQESAESAESRQEPKTNVSNPVKVTREKVPSSHFLIDRPPWTWPEPWHSLFEERAAIMQHDGGLSLAQAEHKAAALLRHDFKRAVAEREW